MPTEKYQSVSIPKRLLEEVDRFLDSKKNKGYTNRSEVVKSAIRKFLGL